MRKSTLGVILAIITLLAVLGVIMTSRSGNNANQSTGQQATSPSSRQDTENETGTQQALPSPAPSSSSSREVEISNFAFSPATITVKKGTTVKWTNKDRTGHTVTPDDENSDLRGSDLLAQNETYNFTFTKAGTYAYHCRPHPEMKGTVIVTE